MAYLRERRLADPRFVAVADLADALDRLKDAYADLDTALGMLEAEFWASGGSSCLDHSVLAFLIS